MPSKPCEARSTLRSPTPAPSRSAGTTVSTSARIPEKFDFAPCPEFHPWDIDASGGLPYYQSAGLERLWILDLDGDLVVINLSDGKRLALAMVDALEFVPSTD